MEPLRVRPGLSNADRANARMTRTVRLDCPQFHCPGNVGLPAVHANHLPRPVTLDQHQTHVSHITPPPAGTTPDKATPFPSPARYSSAPASRSPPAASLAPPPDTCTSHTPR